MIRDEVAGSWKEVIELCARLGKNVAVAEVDVIFGAITQGRAATRYLKINGVNILRICGVSFVLSGSIGKNIQ